MPQAKGQSVGLRQEEREIPRKGKSGSKEMRGDEAGKWAEPQPMGAGGRG